MSQPTVTPPQPGSDQKLMARSASLANNAESLCIVAEEVAERNTVPSRVDSSPTVGESESVNKRQNKVVHGSIETQHPTVTPHWYDPSGRLKKCQQCGREYVAKRATSRFCSGACRTAAYRERHEGAAQ